MHQLPTEFEPQHSSEFSFYKIPNKLNMLTIKHKNQGHKRYSSQVLE